MRSPWLTSAAAVAVLALTACAQASAPQGEESSAEAPTTQTDSISGITCSVVERDEPTAGTSYAHPSESFYAPDAQPLPTAVDLEHLVRSDNAVIVEYSGELPAASITALQSWALEIVATVVLPAPGGPAVFAYTQDSALECDGVDTRRLSEFAATRPDKAVEEHSDEG